MKADALAFEHFSLDTSLGTKSKGSQGGSFSDLLRQKFFETNSLMNHVDDMSERFSNGEPIDVHEIMIAGEKASAALSLAIEVRNRAVDAYREIMRMQV